LLKGNAMAIDNPKEAVMKALQRQQRKAVEGAPPCAESIIELMRSSLYNGAARPPRIETARPPTGANDSLIKARYALTVLRVAKAINQETAARLIRGLAHDFPHPNELPEIADNHLRALDSFSRLAVSLGENIKQQHPWNTALNAATDWLRAVSARQ
jgi:hypothetical protein